MNGIAPLILFISGNICCDDCEAAKRIPGKYLFRGKYSGTCDLCLNNPNSWGVFFGCKALSIKAMKIALALLLPDSVRMFVGITL